MQIVDYDRLTTTYWQNQLSRLEQSRAAIEARDAVATQGRTIPGEADLVFGTGRLVQAAVLFLDISGFSGRAAENIREQDLLLRALTLFFTEMVRICEEYGGSVEKNTGDGLMAYFEDSGGTSAEGGPKRAVSCALTMSFVTESAINIVLRNSGIEPIRFRVGVDYGWITVAKLGAARRFGSLAAVGTTANIASKMLAHGDPGDIVIGQAVKERLPVDWQLRFCVRSPRPSGWVYRLSGAEYRFHKYTGRWASPCSR
jgi:class 3 adenylate cyclase